jgi:hypothetical protein
MLVCITNMCEGGSGVHSQGEMIRRPEECRSLLARKYGGTDHVPIQLREIELLDFQLVLQGLKSV